MRRIANAIALPLAFVLLACGASARHKTIHATLGATDAAHAAFIAFDREHELEIVKAATTKAEGLAAQEAYRAKSIAVSKLLVGVYRAIAAAAIVDDDPSFQSMLTATLQLSQALNEIGVSPFGSTHVDMRPL